MTKYPYYIIFITVIALTGGKLSGQEVIKKDSTAFVIDTLMQAETIDSLATARAKDVHFETGEAIDYLSAWYESDTWNSKDDPLRKSIRRLLFEASNDPLYIAEDYVKQYEWERIKIPASSFYLWDTIYIPIPSERARLRERSQLPVIVDPLLADTAGHMPDRIRLQEPQDTLLRVRDSIIVFNPADLDNIFVQSDERKAVKYSKEEHDTIIVVISDTLKGVISSNTEFPFLHYDYPLVGDSIRSAIMTLMDHLAETDSSRVIFKGSYKTIPVWLSTKTSRMTRLWLRNEWDEEVSVWVGSISRDSVDIVVERGVHFRRPDKVTSITTARVQTKTVDNSRLLEARKIDVRQQYWKFLSEASFVFNQAIIKNWVQGGESNVSTLLDVTGTASFTDKEKNMVWESQGRVKFGLITGGAGSGIRKNIDQIDIVSKFNNKAFGKFDFSTTMLFKTQLAYGYNYPNDSVVVSKFFNPASITLGMGLDYQPNKNTSINFAPLSYKATFIPDTAMIDPTKHGLKADRRSRHEPGASVQISHKTTIFNDINVVNKVRLFTNYIDNPQNIDIDWEMIATARLNWFTDIRLNTHLIYDDDTLIPVLDDKGEQVLNNDGSPKKVPKIQFKELIGLSVIFRF